MMSCQQVTKNVDILPHDCVRARVGCSVASACASVAVPSKALHKSAAAREDTPSRRDEPRQPRNHEGMSASGNELPLDIGDDGNLSELFLPSVST